MTRISPRYLGFGFSADGVPFVLGAAAMTFGFSAFGFLVSRLRLSMPLAIINPPAVPAMIGPSPLITHRTGIARPARYGMQANGSGASMAVRGFDVTTTRACGAACHLLQGSIGAIDPMPPDSCAGHPWPADCSISPPMHERARPPAKWRHGRHCDATFRERQNISIWIEDRPGGGVSVHAEIRPNSCPAFPDNRTHRLVRLRHLPQGAMGGWCCRACGAPVPLYRRADAQFCREACRKRFARARRKDRASVTEGTR